MAAYDAFISYSHAKDKPIAAALQAVMQKLGKPWYRRRAMRVFRDDTSLSATPHLWLTIEQALNESRYLVLLTSPEAAASHWVAKEVQHWLDTKGPDTLLIALTDGQIAWNNGAGDFEWSGASPLPAILKGRFGNEPKWIDLSAYRSQPAARDRKFIELGADIAAAVHGIPKEDLLSQEVRQQRRALRLAYSAVALLLLLVAAAGWEWRQAEIALAQADRNFTAATNVGSSVVESVRDMIAGGNISAKVAEPLLNITSRTVSQLEQEKPNEKLMTMQWRLLNTLSFAYVNVPGQGENAVEQAMKMRVLADALVGIDPKNKQYRDFIVLSEMRIGDALGAIAVFDSALQHYNEGRNRLRAMIAEDASADRKRTLIYIQQRIGDALQNKGRLSEAKDEFEANLAMAKELAAQPKAKPDWVRGLAFAHERMGDIYRELGDRGRALEQYNLYRRTAERLVKLEVPNVPNWAWRLDLWIAHQRIGDIFLEQNDAVAALAEFENFQKWAQEVVQLDSEHGEWERFLANSEIKVGDALMALGRLPEAIAQFSRAKKNYEELARKDQRPRSQRSLAVAYQRLGLARLAMGDEKGARAEFATCAAMTIDETARDAQITVPALVKKDCGDHVAQMIASAPR